MEQPQQNHSEPISEEQAATKAVILAECDKLSAAGITFVALHFDGYGDEGTTETVKCYAGPWFASDEHEPVKYDPPACKNSSRLLCPSDMRTIAEVSATLFSMCWLTS
jgi:hypothetical protein